MYWDGDGDGIVEISSYGGFVCISVKMGFEGLSSRKHEHPPLPPPSTSVATQSLSSSLLRSRCSPSCCASGI